jgi:hypothetical protein
LNDHADRLPGVRQEELPPPLHLGPVPEASLQARRFVRDSLTTLGVAALSDSAELGVSELVANACLHARTAITVALRVVHGKVRIEVSDDSPSQPQEREVGLTATTGRGLRLLSAYGTWGVAEAIDGRIGKTVWFQPRSTPTLPVATDTLDDWPGLS